MKKKLTATFSLCLILVACANKDQNVFVEDAVKHNDEVQHEEIIVENFSHSLKGAIENKQNTEIETRGVITAEEMGKFSDDSLSASLQRGVESGGSSLSLNDLKEKVTSGRGFDSEQDMVFRSQRAPSSVGDSEKYLLIEENRMKQVTVNPVSTFSIDVDTAAYSNIRRMLKRQGQLPPRNAVKIEEMLNYFSYDYPVATSLEKPFSVNTEIAPAPWAKKGDQKLLMQIGLKGYAPDINERPAANLVFLVDVSGSMQSQDKLPLLKKSLKLLVNQMQDNDRIALATYAGNAGLVLDSTPVSKKRQIMQAIDQLQAGGSTHGSAGIHLAYEVAQEHLIEDEINRILIASDGDMNVGVQSIEAFKELMEVKRETGIAITTLGFGTGNYNEALMEQMADVGNGNAVYIDSLLEAQKVLVNEMQSTLLTIAKDVKIQVEFNPEWVSEYRLIGYENRILNREDFRNDKVDAGDIGAGHTVTALYELTLVNSENKLVPELRYRKQSEANDVYADVNADKSHTELAYVNLRYKLPDASISTELGQTVLMDSVKADFNESTNNLQFAASVASFGQLLRRSIYTEGMSYDQVLDIARGARGEGLNLINHHSGGGLRQLLLVFVLLGSPLF